MDDLHDAEMADGTPEVRFGARLRRVRVRAGLSVRGLAKDLDRAHSSISDFENGRRLPGVEVVEQYEDYFGLPRGTLGAQRERARAERLEEPLDATVEENLGDVVCPYMGLRAFEAGDAALFFGRETQVDEDLARLGKSRFIAVIGASGSGKSSFVRAGLLARVSTSVMNGGTSPRVVVLTPGVHPLDALASAINAMTGKSRSVTSDGLRVDPSQLERTIRHAGDRGLVIAVDQFEELFTLCRDDAERARFVEALMATWRDLASPVVVIVALRADFYGHVAAYPELAAAVVANQTLIGPLSPVELRRAIELPAAQTGLLLQPGLADTILEDLAGEPGALPLLSHALLETWKRRRRLMLTVSGYRETGGVRGAIAQTAERTLHSLSEADQAVTRLIFLSLTDIGEGSEPTRRRVGRAELAVSVNSAQRDRALAILAAARLVAIDEHTVTVAHEALIRHWPRLRNWVEADLTGLRIHRRLSAAAREWETLHRDAAVLFRGAQLATASEWASDHPDHLSALERDFLTASQTVEHDELLDKARKNAQLQELLKAARHRTHRLRVLASGLTASMAVLAALAVWAIGQNNDAHRQARQATSLALSSSATSLLSNRSDIALLLAFEAYRASPRVEARSSMLAARITARAPGLVAILHANTRAVVSVGFSPDGHTLAASGDGGTIWLWDTRTHHPLGKPLTGPKGTISSVTFSADGRTLAAAAGGGTIWLWDARTHQLLGRPLTHPNSRVFSVAFSADGRTLASAGDGGTIRLWDTHTHQLLGKPLTSPNSTVFSVAFSADGRTLASAGDGGTIRLWDTRTHQLLGRPLTHPNSTVFSVAFSVAFSADGRTLASAGDGGTIWLWDTRTHDLLGKPLAGPRGTVFSVAFSADGRTLAATGGDGRIWLWDARTHHPFDNPLTGHSGPAASVAFSADGRTLAAAGDGGTIWLWDTRISNPVGRPLTGHSEGVISVAFSADGRTLASGRGDGAIRLWDTHKHGVFLTGPKSRVSNLAFSADGRTLAAASGGGTTWLWDTHTHHLLGKPLTEPKTPVYSLALSADGRILASGRGRRTIRLWDTHTHHPLGKPLTGHTSNVSNLAFSPDGRTLASAENSGAIWLWDTHTHHPLGKPLTGHTGSVYSLVFSPDGRTLASGGLDETTRLWDAHKHKPLGVLPTSPNNPVYSLAFSPDGRTLASTSGHNTIRLWDTRTRKPLGKPLTGPQGRFSGIAFSPDGRALAATGGDTIRRWTKILWRNNTELQNDVCRFVGSSLSRSEWERYAPGISYRQSCP
jgi:WD40 repeat protein/transcriptional regulator with XRE-family HTH domain